MASAVGPTTSAQTNFYVIDRIASPDAAKVKAAAVANNKISYVTTPGAVGEDANLINRTYFGDNFQTQIPGPTAFRNFELTMDVHHDNAGHNKLKSLAKNADVAIVVGVQTGSGKATYFYITGKVSNKSYSFEGGSLNTFTVGFAMDADPLVFDDAG